MASKVQICNMALSRIGQNIPILSLDEQSQAAQLCSLHYEECRLEVLRDFDWPFAEARVYLADIGSPPQNWCYRYRYPTDAVKARRITIVGTRNPQRDQRIPFEVIHATGGRAIVTDQQGAELAYTINAEDTTYFDPLFTSALAWRLGAELAMGLQSKAENYQLAMQNYQIKISQAQAVASAEGQRDPMPESEFVTVRG